MTELFKKASPLKCDDHRGILQASHLAKQFLKPIKPVYDASLPVVQMGAVSKRGADFGTHMLTSFIESRTSDNDGKGICFVDLVKAFDRVLRELVMGWPRLMTSHPIEYLRKVGVGREDAIWLFNWITKRRPLFKEGRGEEGEGRYTPRLRHWSRICTKVAGWRTMTCQLWCSASGVSGRAVRVHYFQLHLPPGHGSCQGQAA